MSLLTYLSPAKFGRLIEIGRQEGWRSALARGWAAIARTRAGPGRTTPPLPGLLHRPASVPNRLEGFWRGIPEAQILRGSVRVGFSGSFSGSPEVSVIVPVYNQFHYTLRCLWSILQAGDAARVEVIVADDGSTDETQAFFSALPGLRYVRHSQNLGFVRSCNRAAGRATAPVLYFLNNDTAVLPGWIDTILATLETHPAAGLVGSKLIYPNGLLQEAGGYIWRDGGGAPIAVDGAYGSVSVDIGGSPTSVETLLSLDGPYAPVYEAHPAMTQEWAAQLIGLGVSDALVLSYDRATGDPTFTLGDLAALPAGSYHTTFHFALNNHLAKDNRIPPFGMSYDEAVARNILPVPGDQYGAPGPGGTYEHWDEVALNPPVGAVSADIVLYYQPTSWEYIQFLDLANDGSNAFLGQEGQKIRDAWLATGMAAPHAMTSTTWALTVPACMDLLDNDGDGLKDYPDDPGCSATVDESENAAGVACDDRLDDDGDGLIDFPADPGCEGPADTAEEDPDILLPVPASLDFGEVAVGTVATLNLEIRNVGSDILLLPVISSSNNAIFRARRDQVVVASLGLALLLLAALAGAGAERRERLRAAVVALALVTALVLSQSSEAARRRPPAVQIGPGETAQIPVEFHPAAAEAYAETLTLTSNDPDEGSVTVRLLGVGTP